MEGLELCLLVEDLGLFHRYLGVNKEFAKERVVNLVRHKMLIVLAAEKQN